LSKNYRPLDATVYPRFSGIRTFMRLPHVTDLREVDFAVVGVPFDTGGTFRVGARFGPEGIRSASMLLRPFNPELNVDIFEVCSGVDYGDLTVTPGYLPESHQQIANEVSILLESDATPIFLGGDHSVTLPELRAMVAKYGPVALIQFDSHGDLWEGYFGGKDTHGTPFRRAIEEGLIDLDRSSQVGLRGSVYTMGDIMMSRDVGFQVITGAELHDIGTKAAAQAIRERAGNGPTFLTFDIDFADPAYAPGTGTPEVGGFTSAECQLLLRGLVGVNFVGFDIVEVMPPYDLSGLTSLLAANLVYEFISLIAISHRDNEGAVQKSQ